MQSKIRAKQHEELSHELFLTKRKKKIEIPLLTI